LAIFYFVVSCDVMTYPASGLMADC